MRNITLITCTGGRPEAFNQCIKMINAQTVPLESIRWIVVDDLITSEVITPAWVKDVDPKISVVPKKGPKRWTEEINTQRYNMDKAFEAVIEVGYIFIIEDDDYYAPNYLEVMLDALKYVDVVGISNALYYQVQIPGFKYMQNYQHASLCQTGINTIHFNKLYKAVHSGEKYFDIELWRDFRNNSVPFTLINNPKLSIGIKGLPGKSGIGIGHTDKGYYFDIGSRHLKQFVSEEDFEFYSQFIKVSKNASTV